MAPPSNGWATMPSAGGGSVPRRHPMASFLHVALLFVATAVLVAGCGGSGPSAESTSSSAAPTSLAPSARFSAINGTGTNSGELPVVYVDPSPEKRWTYVYHIQGEPFREAEFLGLCRTLARDTPAMPVNIVPNTAMSREEIELVRARIRENGLANIYILSTSGTRRVN